MVLNIGLYSSDKNCGKTVSVAYLAESFATLGYKVVAVESAFNTDLGQMLISKEEVAQGLLKIMNKGSLVSWFYLKSAADLKQNSNAFNFEIQIFDLSNIDFENFEFQESIIIVPVEMEYYGLDKLKKTLNNLRDKDKIKQIYLLQNKVKEYSEVYKKQSKFLAENFKSMLLDTHIARNFYLGAPKLSIQNLNETIPNFGFADYLKLANELLEKNGKK
jgi:hypothetical protein